MKTKNQNGITLIALVITIIVLLILAGVSISSIMRESGIASKAKQSKMETKIAEIEEMAGLIAGEYAIKNEGEAATASYIISELISRNYIEEYQVVDDGQGKDEGIIEIEGKQITIKGVSSTESLLDYLTITSDGEVNIKDVDTYYDLNEQGAKAIEGKANFPFEELIIPETINGITVTSLGYEFVVGKGVKILKLPKTVTYLDMYEHRFYKIVAPDLEKVYVYSSQKAIVNRYFRNITVIYLDEDDLYYNEEDQYYNENDQYYNENDQYYNENDPYYREGIIAETLKYFTVNSAGYAYLKNHGDYYETDFPLATVIIPETINGITVTRMSNHIMPGTKVLELPKTLIELNWSLFIYATDLEELKVYSNLKNSINKLVADGDLSSNVKVTYLD